MRILESTVRFQKRAQPNQAGSTVRILGSTVRFRKKIPGNPGKVNSEKKIEDKLDRPDGR